MKQSKQSITLAQAWDLIKLSSFQTIDGYVATIFSGGDDDKCPPFTGDPANELMTINWEDDEGYEFAIAVVEDGIAEGRVKFWWDEDEGILSVPSDDDENEHIEVTLYTRMGRKYL